MNPDELLVLLHTELSSLKQDLQHVVDEIVTADQKGSRVLVFGNGGSTADSEHIVTEIMKGFLVRRLLTKKTALIRQKLLMEVKTLLTLSTQSRLVLPRA